MTAGRGEGGTVLTPWREEKGRTPREALNRDIMSAKQRDSIGGSATFYRHVVMEGIIYIYVSKRKRV